MILQSHSLTENNASYVQALFTIWNYWPASTVPHKNTTIKLQINVLRNPITIQTWPIITGLWVTPKVLIEWSTWPPLVNKWMTQDPAPSSQNFSITTLSSAKLAPMGHISTMTHTLAPPVQPSKQLIQTPTNAQLEWPTDYSKPISVVLIWSSTAFHLVNGKTFKPQTKPNTLTSRTVHLISPILTGSIVSLAIHLFLTSISTTCSVKIVVKRSTIAKEKNVC